jgi:hypothetical protein
MKSRMIRAIAVLAAVASLSTAGVAAAATPHTAQAAPSGGLKAHPVTTTVSHVEVSAWPTGGCPADEQVCGRFEYNIWNQLNNLSNAIDSGDADHAVELSEAVDNLTDMAEDAGCAVMFT